MTEVVDKVEVKVVTIKPVKRKSWHPEGVNVSGLFDEVTNEYQCEMDSRTNQIKTGLTEQEERELEIKLYLSPGTLNKYNKDYWGNFRIKVPRSKGKKLYLDNPVHFLEHKILLQHSKFANSAYVLPDNPEAEFYLSMDAEDAKIENNKAKVEIEALKTYATLSLDMKIDIINYYALLEGRTSGKVSKGSSSDMIEATLYNKVKDNPEDFLRIIKDPALSTKILIDKLVSARFLIKEGAKYSVYGGDTIGNTLEETVSYLENPSYQATKLALIQKLQAIK